MTEDNSWRTATFRQSVVSKIEEAIRQSGMNTSRNSIEMENHVYVKAKNRDEYLGFVARLILHVREMNSKKNAGAMGGPQQNPGGQQSGPGVGQMGGQMQAQVQGNQLQNQLTAGGMNQIGGQQMPMQGQLQGPMPGQMASQMHLAQQMQMPSGGPPMQCGPMGAQQMMTVSMQQQMVHQGKPPPSGGPGPGMMINNGFPRNPTPNQFLRLSPSPSVQSPAGMACQGPPGSQMIASPAMAPSPGAQMAMMGSAGPPRSVGMAPSPGSSLNTPGQPGQSPMGMPEEQAYRDKVRQLSKFIEPLRKMIARIGNDGEQIQKMKKLLEILTNPTQRMPLETLLKCEVVLEKMDFKRSDGSVPPPTTHSALKEHHPLLEAVSNCLQNPTSNHTLHRTFGPTLDALFGPEIKLVPPLKKIKREEPTSDIPDVLQGEIARLDQRFKVSLDPNQQPGSKSIQLICCLDDKHLPCVPPVSLTVPEDYPNTSPTCHMASHEYNATKFLSAVQSALVARIKKLPKHFSVSQLLDTWEMSVRQASSPQASNSVSQLAILMGL